MRRYLLVIITACCALTAQAKQAPLQFEGKLLTYQQLMTLAPAKRMTYLKHIGELLAKMEHDQRKLEVADYNYLEDIKQMKEQVAFFMRLMAVFPEANAQDSGPRVPTWQAGTGWVCTGSGLAFDKRVGTCVVTRVVDGKTVMTWPASTDYSDAGRSCPEGTRPFFNSNTGPRRCVPQESFDALSKQRQTQIGRGVQFPNNYFRPDDGPEKTMADVLGAGTHNSDGSLIATGDKPAQPAQPAPAKPDPAKPDPAKPDPVPPVADATKPEPPPAAQPNCVAPKFRCDDQTNDRDKLIAAWRKRGNKDNACIVGGFFSEYKNPRNKAAGTCEPKTQLDLNGTKTSCAQPDPKKLKRGQKPPPMKVLCNPLIFCLGMKVDDKLQKYVDGLEDPGRKTAIQNAISNAATIDGSSEKIVNIHLCEDIGQDLSERCNKKLEDHVAGRASVNGMGVGEKYVACDSAKVKGLPMQAAWDEVRKGIEDKYKSWCKGDKDEFGALFCNECKIIAKRIMDYNTEATGQACVPPAPGEAGAQPGAPEAQK